MLFRSEHESGEVPLAPQQEPSLRSVDEVQPRIVNSASSIAAGDSLADPATLFKVLAPLKGNRTGQNKSPRITKATNQDAPSSNSRPNPPQPKTER
jgi:hypothetical protein